MLAQPECLEVGDKAPSFELLDDQGNTWKSEIFGKTLVYFYPAAMTGGCTKQARLRDDRAKWREKNVEIVGLVAINPRGLLCS